jgi:hypothetical protein
MCAYLEICTLEADVPARILDKGVIDIVSKYIWIPSTKERGFAHQGVRFFPEA